MDIKHIFRALRNHNYRLYFIGQTISLTGTWMQMVAQSWLIYRMTHNPFLLGIVGFTSQIPTFLLAAFAGVIADRLERRRLLMLTQILAMLQAFVFFAILWAGPIHIWQIVALSFCSGLINSLDLPVRQSFTVDMIEHKADLSNAIALNSSIINIARFSGPALAGIIIAAAGEMPCILLNAFSYLPIIIALGAMKVAASEPKKNGRNILDQLKEGFDYAFHFVPIRMILVLLGLASLIAGGYQALIPVFAKEVFYGGPKVLGFLMSATGLGALSGAIYLAGRKSVLGLGRVIPLMAGVFGFGVLCFALSSLLILSLFLSFIIGFGMMVQMAASNTVLQTIVDEDKRGRVMSFYTMAFMGTSPIGSLLAGASASHFGVHKTMAVAGVLCLAGAWLFNSRLSVLRKHIRPIYEKKGIITPQMAES